MSDEGYNGWTNWATWYVVSELENNEEWYKLTQRLVRTEEPTEEFEKLAKQCLFPSSDVETYGEMSREEFENVDWDDIRDTLISD